MPHHLWQDHTSPELGALAQAGAVVIVPVGSIEQHGAHLPVSTDTTAVYEVARQAATQVTEFPVLVAPPVWWGVSPHHMGFPGTISLSTDTFILLMSEICQSIAAHGFQRILILNGHGGNAALVSVIAQRLSEQRPAVWVAAATYFAMLAEDLQTIGESAFGGMSHACEMETSLLLTLRPDLVHMDKVDDFMGQPWTSFFAWDMRQGGTVYYPYDMLRDTRTGVIGAPSLATREKGDRILAAAATKVAAFLREYHAMGG
jgi:creatinine amidohydrolase